MEQTEEIPGVLIRTRRDELGLSRSKFGRLVDKESNTVYAWENGSSKPDFDSCVALVQKVGIDPQALLGTPGRVDADKVESAV